MLNVHQGHHGESLAEKHLIFNAKLKILAKNWRCRLGEIDLVARDQQGSLVFVEVKSRSQDPLGAWEAINRQKQKRLWRLAHAYLSANKLPLETAVRFDVVIVDLKTQTVHHEPDAFIPEREI